MKAALIPIAIFSFLANLWALPDPPPNPSAGAGQVQLLTFSDGNQYYLILPYGYAPTQYSYPLVCYLTSTSSSATDAAQTATFQQNFPCIFVAPWCPKEGGSNPGSWSNYNWNDSETEWAFRWNGTLTSGGQFAVNLINYFLANYSVNPQRVYITGESDGAFGCSEISCFHNTLFAAVMTISGAGATGDNWGTVDQGPNGPIPPQTENPDQAQYPPYEASVNFQAYHGTNDPSVPFGQDQDWINKIMQAGGTSQQFIPVQGGQHTIWNAIYNDFSATGGWAWMFSQRLGTVSPPPPPTPIGLLQPTLTLASDDPLSNGTDDVYHVTMTSASPGVAIHFTLDGSTPSNTWGNGWDNGSTLWVHVPKGGSVTLKAVAYSGNQVSPVASITLPGVENPTPTPSPTPTPPTPTPTPVPTPTSTGLLQPTLTLASGDPLFNGTDDVYHVTMTSASPGVTIHFTLDGSTPSNTWGNGWANGSTLWVHVPNGGSVTLEAVAYNGNQVSPVASITLP